jgi:2-polyprenyl-3-methyl-5-hydroxy-6-metoxy-1,4-benzoquinol methylase
MAAATELACPMDHAALRCDGAALACTRCGRTYAKLGHVWDFRTVLSDAATGWDAEAFDHAYQKAEIGFDGGLEYALRTRIPRLAEEYREGCKGRRLERFVQVSRPAQVLDLGCGNGWFCFRLAGLSPESRFSGVDVSPYCVNLFQRRLAEQGAPPGGSDMTVALAGGEDLPFADHQFEAVILQEVLEHVRDPEQTLREAERVLAPGGAVLITTPTRLMTQFWKATAWLPSRLRRWWRGEPPRPREKPVHDQPLPRREIRRIVRVAGLDVASWHRVIFLPHESYLQFIPLPLLRIMVALAKLLERTPGVGFLGLHHVIVLRRKESVLCGIMDFGSDLASPAATPRHGKPRPPPIAPAKPTVEGFAGQNRP